MRERGIMALLLLSIFVLAHTVRVNFAAVIVSVGSERCRFLAVGKHGQVKESSRDDSRLRRPGTAISVGHSHLSSLF